MYIIKFSNDQKIVYKPRDQHIEQQWSRLIIHFNSKNSIKLKLPRILPKSGYGWSEFIESDNCSNTSDLSLFYTRAGIWAGLLYCLCGSDMHSDNIILNRDQPVLIDLEMSILPCIRAKRSKYTASAESVALELRNSVLSVGILPWFMTDTNTSLENRGGVMLESGHYEGGDSNISSGLLHYKKEFISGFEQTMNYIIRNRSSTCFQDILYGFCGLKIRVAFKHTRFYWNILQRLKKVNNLNDGICWSAHADFVSRIWDWNNLPRAMWKINRQERIALYNLNIPVFNVQTESKEIHSNEEIVFKISQSGFSRVKKRIKSINNNEIEKQKILIETTLGACSIGAKKIVSVEYKKDLEQAVLSDSDIVIHCNNLHNILLSNCVSTGLDINWVSLTSSNQQADIANLGTLGLGVYSGIGGVAIAYASMYEVTHKDQFKIIANRALILQS